MKINDFRKKKLTNQKISMLTCYDYPSAKIIAESDVDCILVGDSVAMVVHGHENTTMATMDMMLMHTKAVARGGGKKFIVSDLPFMSYKVNLIDTLNNVKSLIQSGAHAVKLEGADDEAITSIQKIIACGIPVMGHIGLTPQSINAIGGHKVQRDEEQLINDAKALEKAGCFALVLECVPAKSAAIVSQQLSIPTIGIGAGNQTDGQVLVWHDMLGLQDEFKPKFLKQFSKLKNDILKAISLYHDEVEQQVFPDKCHEY
jgi:3-methyl-2-oxobutanoate hydroxymethyltransferase